MTSLETRECPKCQATWIGGQHYWYTGKKGNELDLAGLVCNNHGDETCINPCAGYGRWSNMGRPIGQFGEIRR